MYLHTDGYPVYHDLPQEITVVGCWAHARRKFDEAMKSLPKGIARSSSAAQGLAYCNLLFKIEDALAALPQKERYDQRLKHGVAGFLRARGNSNPVYAVQALLPWNAPLPVKHNCF